MSLDFSIAFPCVLYCVCSYGGDWQRYGRVRRSRALHGHLPCLHHVRLPGGAHGRHCRPPPDRGHDARLDWTWCVLFLFSNEVVSVFFSLQREYPRRVDRDKWLPNVVIATKTITRRFSFIFIFIFSFLLEFFCSFLFLCSLPFLLFVVISCPLCHFRPSLFSSGEDGPTHQPIESLAMCRATPNVQVMRPADGNEVCISVFDFRVYLFVALLFCPRSYFTRVGRGSHEE